MAIMPSGMQQRQGQAPPTQSGGDGFWDVIVPLVVGSAVTAGLGFALTPAGTAAVAPSLGSSLGLGAKAAGAVGTAAASTGGGMAGQLTAKAMHDPTQVQYSPNSQLRQLATKPLQQQQQAPAQQQATPQPQTQTQAQGNPFMTAFKSGFARGR